uniref:Uncharacterized protein n=1 Tax=viral metagenome TaxID=1070528 RepID=A0A6C0K3P6_9ZZZZ
MNTREYYDRQKEPWGLGEIQDIRSEYETNEMTISQIADIHKRTPGCISYKLKNLGLITHNTLSRGYIEYKNSDLYREIIEQSKFEDASRKLKKERRINMSEKITKYTTKPSESEVLAPNPKSKQVVELRLDTSCAEIAELKNEVLSIKKDVREILRLMNAMYEFESQSPTPRLYLDL